MAVHKIECSINEKIRDNYDDITIPNRVYITFEEEEAVKIAHMKNSARETMLLGEKMHFN